MSTNRQASRHGDITAAPSPVLCRADVHSLGVDSGFDHSKLLDTQKLNHFPRHYELTRK